MPDSIASQSVTAGQRSRGVAIRGAEQPVGPGSGSRVSRGAAFVYAGASPAGNAGFCQPGASFPISRAPPDDCARVYPGLSRGPQMGPHAGSPPCRRALMTRASARAPSIICVSRMTYSGAIRYWPRGPCEYRCAIDVRCRGRSGAMKARSGVSGRRATDVDRSRSARLPDQCTVVVKRTRRRRERQRMAFVRARGPDRHSSPREAAGQWRHR